MCSAVDSNPCGLPYKAVIKQIGRHRLAIESRARKAEISDHLFPNPLATDWSQLLLNPEEVNEETPTHDFTPSELHEADARLPHGKATGLDEIPNEVLARVSSITLCPTWRPSNTSNATDAIIRREKKNKSI